jgi:hypothetical protein
MREPGEIVTVRFRRISTCHGSITICLEQVKVTDTDFGLAGSSVSVVPHCFGWLGDKQEGSRAQRSPLVAQAAPNRPDR